MFFYLFTCTSGLIEDKNMPINFCCWRFIILKVVHFRLIILERSECTRLSLFEKFPDPPPPSTSVIPHSYRATCVLSLVNSLLFIKTLKNADQIVKILCTDAFSIFKIFKFKLLDQRKSPSSTLPEKQMQNAASDQGLHWQALFAYRMFYLKFECKWKIPNSIP